MLNLQKLYFCNTDQRDETTKQVGSCGKAFVLDVPGYNLDHGSVYVCLSLSLLSSYWTLSRGSAIQF